ncbi:hypothetical protein L198_01330 [Cryptococcus wingfieldii CBS 7118]|uniref:Uncharacterized protein n=1 Tax=Cryptococcus wingfieldii CBS 7118 TaxID=1295528 RepID=A0A1E3JZ55_9TREE|nr:hypothetical protein L198_01330 [Cryptococcus wingfieldii CBS 7118]ODO06099.1 hypothetical protein L198_01330 [Cryptococcus wingfieldii CBS 7118]
MPSNATTTPTAPASEVVAGGPATARAPAKRPAETPAVSAGSSVFKRAKVELEEDLASQDKEELVALVEKYHRLYIQSEATLENASQIRQTIQTRFEELEKKVERERVEWKEETDQLKKNLSFWKGKAFSMTTMKTKKRVMGRNATA